MNAYLLNVVSMFIEFSCAIVDFCPKTGYKLDFENRN